MLIDTIVCGDCLNIMPGIPDDSVDMVLADPPYGTTACKWDSVISLELMWGQLKRIIKPKGAIVLTASQPFTTALIASNMKMFKYCWVWEKTKAGNFINANNAPLKLHEDVCVFSDGTCANRSPRRMPYNPQGVRSVNKKWSRPRKYDSEHNYKRPSHKLSRVIKREGFPSSVIKINSVHNPPHPTQKPIALMAYLIKTYTDKGDTVLDFVAGSGTTAIAALALGRHFYGIEINPEYVKMANYRIKKMQLKLVGLKSVGRNET